MKRRRYASLLIAWLLVAWGTEAGSFAQKPPALVLACRPDNDLCRVLTECRVDCVRYDSPAQAVQAAGKGDGVLLLADGYPAKTTPLDAGLFDQAARKELRLYVEYPSFLPGITVGAPRGTHWERAVVASEAFAPALARLRILAIHDCRFVPMKADHPHLVIGRVAGFDTAVYGLAKQSFPILFELPKQEGHGEVLIATTKLSHFLTARYAPHDAWQSIWKYVFAWLQPGQPSRPLHWMARVRPSFGAEEILPANIEQQALQRGIDWYFNSRMVVHPSMMAKYDRPANEPSPPLANPDLKHDWPYGHRTARMPELSTPVGDGALGVLEGFDAKIFSDGTQPVRWWIRNDCNGEIAGAMAAAGATLQNPAYLKTAGNLGDWLYFRSRMSLGDRANPKHPAYGLFGWFDTPHYCGPGSMDGYAVYYGDDNARSMMGMMLAAATLKTDRFNERLLKCLLANLRISGQRGFQPDRLDQGPLEKAGWLHFFRDRNVSYSPHMQATRWACDLWAYRQTGFELFRQRAKTAMGMTMAAYPDRWVWMNGIQQERAKMLLALAWLVRVEDTPEHRAWLRRIAGDLLATQDACGAIREEIGQAGKGGCPPPASNEAYGTAEAPLIQSNADAASDLLYTCNFAFVALHEAAAATGDSFYRDAEEKLAKFLCRIQIRSETHPELDGGWFRAFDFKRWEYWASSTDAGWGAWSIESGWTQSWITSVLALRRMQTSLWDLTKGVDVAKHFDRLRPEMLPDTALAANPGGKVRHAAVGKAVALHTKFSDSYPAEGATSLTDGLLAETDHRDAAWLGFHEDDLVATIDLGEPVALSELSGSFLQDVSVGIFLPRRVEFLAGDDPAALQPVGSATPVATEKQPGPLKEVFTIKNLHQRARYVEVRAANVGKLPAWHTAAGQKAWLFVEEVMVNPIQAGRGRPRIQKIGTVDCDMVETTPIVFRQRLYRVEYVRERYLRKAPGERGSYCRVIDVATGELMPPFARGFHLCSAYVEGDTVYVFGVEKWGANKVQGFRSNDLKTWESFTALDLPGWSIFNTSVCHGDGRYVMAFEINAPTEEAGTPWTIRFAESKDLRNWKLTPASCVYSKDRFTACPTLMFQDEKFYMIYTEALPGPEYLSYIARSPNLIDWELSPLNPVIKFSSEDRNVAAGARGLTPAERERIATAANLNNSDVDLCEFEGHVVLYYSWGNQTGIEHLAQAQYDGSLRDFLTGFFPSTKAASGRNQPDEIFVNPGKQSMAGLATVDRGQRELALAGEPPATTPGRYEGRYCAGTGDVEFLRLIDESFAFFHPNPIVPSLGMLYKPEWDLLIEGANWDAWWIQNSYGFSYAATPFLQDPWFSLMQRSFDLFWDNQGDGKRRGKLVGPATGSYHGLVGPDGCLGDCALPGIIAYKQGDGDMSVHEWFYEATAAGVVIQAEILLASRDRKAIEYYLPKMERACDFIEKARDPKNNLFLVGPACNLLAPSYGGVRQPDGSFGKGYLAGLSITYLAALDRMVELYKLAGGRENLAKYERRQKVTRESLPQLLTPAGYFVKSIEPSGVKHGVLGQKQFGYLEGVANADAVALRVVDDQTAKSIYQQIAGFPAIRPFDFLLVNAPGLDDTYWNWGNTSGPGFEGFHAFGDWVNGGVWGTVEGRAILMYYRLGKFEDIRRSATRAMKWAKDFRMDSPQSQRGENTHNPWSDSGQFQVGGVAVMIDNFAIPASTIRGLFDYDYRSDRLILRPRVPGSITQYTQKEPIRFGSKRLHLSCRNGGPKVASVMVNGQPQKISSPEAVNLRFDELPSEAKVEIVTEGGWPDEKATAAYPAIPALQPVESPVRPLAPLSESLKQPFAALLAMSQILTNEPEAAYERAFVAEAMNAFEACRVRAAMDPGPGYYRPIHPKRRTAVIEFYEQTALGMYHGFARRMSVYARRGDARQKRVASLFAQIPDAPPFPQSGTLVRHAAVDKPVTLRNKPSDNYLGEGAASLTDGLLAQTDHRDAAWLGFLADDLVATIDLGEPVALSELSGSFLQDVPLGIFLPRRVEFLAGNDPASLQPIGTATPVATEKQPGPLKEVFTIKNLHQRVRFVEVRAANIGKIPSWHTAAGQKAWLFVDEVMVNQVPTLTLRELPGQPLRGERRPPLIRSTRAQWVMNGIARLRLRITKNVGTPIIRELAAFHAGGVSGASTTHNPGKEAASLCGNWNAGAQRITLDLTRHILLPATYEVTFSPAASPNMRAPEVEAGTVAGAAFAGLPVLKPDTFKHYVVAFNRNDHETVTNHIPNAMAWDWIATNVPLLDCPDKDLEEIYYFRWWTYRKHLKQTPDGFVVTEFLPQVSWSKKHNTINCPVGHHFYEGRWIRDPKFLDDYARFYFGKGGDPGGVTKVYSNWLTDGLYARYLVNADKALVTGLLDELVKNHEAWSRDGRTGDPWQKSRRLDNGLFWQIDSWEGGEYSIGGTGIRPMINSYRYGDAAAIARIAELAGRKEMAEQYRAEAEQLRKRVQDQLWDPDAKFFKVLRHEKVPTNQYGNSAAENCVPGKRVKVREIFGYVPWYFNMPDDGRGYEEAWRQLIDPQGFLAPYGPTVAERRHPNFKINSAGCEWCGASWPFSTAQTLTALANLLNNYRQGVLGKKDYFDTLKTYTRSHRLKLKDGVVVPWIDESLNPDTGAWITNGDRGANYNHSTYCDLVISGLVGLRPRADDIIEVNPLVPEGTWDYFCLDQVSYHGRLVTILFDRTGERYGRGKGLRVLVNGRQIAGSDSLQRVTATLP